MTNFVQILIDGASLGSLYALVALAIGLVFGIMRLVNFAQAEYTTLGAYSLILPSTAATPVLFIGAWPPALMIFTVLLITMVLALATERMVFRPLRGKDPATLLVAAFALSYMLQHVISVVYSTKPKSLGFGAKLIEPVILGSFRIPLSQLLTAAVTVILLLLLALFLKRSRYGIQMRAAAENFLMAQLLGVRANTVVAISFAISGGIGGIVALLLLVQTGVVDYRMGVLLVIYAFFGTVIGGMGSLTGAALGGFLLGFLSQFLQGYLPASLVPFRDAFVFLLVIGILLVRPQGLVFSKAQRERV